MKRRNKNLTCLIGIFMFIIPMIGFVSFANAQKTSQASTENSLIYGAVLGTPKEWDPAISEADSMDNIKNHAIEDLVWQDTKGVYHPLLAENWTIHERPNGTSADGSNSGGVAAYEFKLREGVTFHDGSEFNASVAKWNIDRVIQISGYEDRVWSDIHWMNPGEYESRFLPTWNLSWALNDPEVSLIDTAAWASITDGDFINYTSRTGIGAGEYNSYYIWFDTTGDGSADPAPAGKTEIYVNISTAVSQENVSSALAEAIGAVSEIKASSTTDNVTITNDVDGDVPDIADFNSGLSVSTLSDGIIRNPFLTTDPEYIPIINSTIVESEYVLNVTLNAWFEDLGLFTWYGMISQESYGPWENTSISGYQSVPNAPDGTPFPGHMIGTGPYEFESVDFLIDGVAHSTKFENYWNTTALEAAGVFSVTDFYTRFFADYTSRGNALLATDIDLVGHMLQNPAPIADVKSSSYINYIPTVPDASVNTLVLQTAEGIHEPLSILGGLSVADWFPSSDLAASWGVSDLRVDATDTSPLGLNKTVRKALSYAYDYSGFMSAQYPETGGGGVYCWSPWGMSSPYTEEGTVSHPGPEPDVSTARQILLADPYYAAKCAARGLSIANTTAEWKSVAASNPIATYTYLSYPGQTSASFITEACENLGFAIDERQDASVPGDLWTKFVGTGRAALYDIHSYVFLMNPLDPSQYGPYWYTSLAARLPLGYGYNYAHLRNATVDNIFSSIEFLEDKQDSYNELADILINKEVPAIYMSQGNMGICLNAGFNYTARAKEAGGPTTPGISIAGIGGSRSKASTLPPEIPGFPMPIILLTMMIASIGVIYIIKRKRKQI